MLTLKEVQELGTKIKARLVLADEMSPVSKQYPYTILNFEAFSEIHDSVRFPTRLGLPTVYSLELKCEVDENGEPVPFDATLSFREARIVAENDPNFGKKAIFPNLYRAGMESKEDRLNKFAALAKRAAEKYLEDK